MSTELEQRIANLSLEKRVQLEQRILDRLHTTGSVNSIPRRGTPGPAQLSFSQERLWFMAQLYPGQTTYNEASAYRFRGPLDVEALQVALDGVVQRHEILRTTYYNRGGSPVQVIEPLRSVPLSVVDVMGVAEDERVAEAQRRFAEVIEDPFDLTSDLMLRGCLYRLDDDDHILLTVHHHIASDGWSSRRFWSEVAELYAAGITGRPARLPALPIQYVDYAVWQRERLQDEILQRQLAYWREQLADLPQLQLPTDRQRSETLSFRGAGERFLLDPALVAKLRSLARAEATTLHTVLMAAYVVLLSRTVSQDDLAIGVPVAGRLRIELEPLIGFFVNTLVIRAQFKGNPSFRVLLQDMHQKMLGAQDHQEVPFERLVEALEPERRLNRHPLVAATFQLSDLPQASLDLPQTTTVEAIEVPNLHAKFDMDCSLVVGPEGISGHWRYATDLFYSATIRRMIGHYQTILEAIVEDPECPVGRLPMLTQEERHDILSDWNRAVPLPIPPECLVHELFEAQVLRTPDAVAVVATDRQLTYAELNQRANQVARRLQELGVGPETTVGLYCDRTSEIVIGLLGILKAGGVFVPLDPSAPSARLKMLAEDAGLQAVLTTETYLPGWPAIGIPVECLDTEHWNRYPASPDPESAAQVDSTAYILYTSGSTGKPKGVVVEHRQLLSYVYAAVAQYGMTEGGVFAMVQPLTFDSCQTMILPALGWGGTLHLIDREQSLNAAALRSYFQHHEVDFVKISPAHLSALGASGGFGMLLPKRCLIIGGEAIHWQLAEQLQSMAPSCAIWNEYGPTETTVGVLTHEITAAGMIYRSLAASVPVGRPLSGVRIYILDRHDNPVPIGVRGQICIGGSFVTRGYLNRPEQTAAQFRIDPLSGERLYRTGDIGRWLSDGVVEFLGRDDGQVKIRGFRVEPGEVETVLIQHPDVKEAVVLARDGKRVGDGDEPGYQSLVAYYVVTTSHAIPSADSLRSFLGQNLPTYMIPSSFVNLEHLPLTMHGKIDRDALPSPDIVARSAHTPYMPPHSSEEEPIASIWCEVLGLDQVGIHDNFFELGGHSLLATQVISRIARVFDVEVPVRTLFDRPTVAEIALEVKNLVAGQEDHRRNLEAALAQLSKLSPEERESILNTARMASK